MVISKRVIARELLPKAANLKLLRLEISERGWTVAAEGNNSAVCPNCATRSRSRHSRYRRKLQDLSVQGSPVTLRVGVGCALGTPGRSSVCRFNHSRLRDARLRTRGGINVAKMVSMLPGRTLDTTELATLVRRSTPKMCAEPVLRAGEELKPGDHESRRDHRRSSGGRVAPPLGTPRRVKVEEIVATLDRSAIVVKPRQPFWIGCMWLIRPAAR
jgi:hypothetical protein